MEINGSHLGTDLAMPNLLELQPYSRYVTAAYLMTVREIY